MSDPTSIPPLPISLPYRTATLSNRKPTRFDLTPGAAELRLLAQTLGISAVSNLHFKGEMRPLGKHDFELRADLSATVEQPCSISLVPVITKIQENVQRRYLADLPDPDADEIEMPADDTQEPLPEVIDIGAVLAEALALALPLYPRAPGAELPTAVFAAPGVAPLRDEDLRPFAGLASLAQRMQKPEDEV